MHDIGEDIGLDPLDVVVAVHHGQALHSMTSFMEANVAMYVKFRGESEV